MAPGLAGSTAIVLAVIICTATCSDGARSIVSCPQGVEIFNPRYELQPRLPMFAECKHLKNLHQSDIKCQITKRLIIQANLGSVVQWIHGKCTTASHCDSLKSLPGYSPDDGVVINAQSSVGCCQPKDLSCIRRLVDF